MPQQIIRTEDVVECLDDRLHASQDYPNIGVVAGEDYPSVLSKIELQLCSLAQKLAINNTLSSPSALNPVVLKDDIITYYPQDDLGEIKDAVNALVDLPLTGNTLNDLRPVLSIGAIYRWDGSAWQPFIKTGTIDHTQLIDQNADTNFLHISISELSSISSQTHSHLNKLLLDAITALGSGIIISAAERARIPTSDEKDALAGSVYAPPNPPSSTNRYVTNVDPRLNTIKNPYITFGLSGTGATYQGSDIADVEIALASLATGGSIDFINALEILPAVYPLNGGINYQGMVWSDVKPILIEALASRESVFQLSPQPAGSTGFWIASGDGQVTVRGMTFELGGTTTLGVLIERDNTIFEDCTFSTSAFPIPVGNVGVRVAANGCNIRRCVFKGNLAQGIDVVGDNCIIESCRFDLASISYPAISVTGSFCLVTSSIVSQGSLVIGALAEDTIFDKNRMGSSTSFIDSGINTRWLGGIAQDHQQAYIGRTRTVGLVNSHADFRSASETAFIAALSDPYTREIEILEGTYTFVNPVTVPDGKSLKSVRRGAITINGSGVTCFVLNSFTKLQGFNLSATGASGITATGATDVEIRDCSFVMNGPDSPTSYAIVGLGVFDFRVIGCQISGTRAIYLSGDSRSKILHNIFSTTVYSAVSDLTTADLTYADNTEEGSVPLLFGVRAIVRGNQFLGSLPTKLGTTDSLWIGNYPVEANNTTGIDTVSISTGALLKSINSTGSYRSSFTGTASYAFTETGTPTIVTNPIFIGARLDRTRGYTVTLNWTAAVFSGDVLWEVTPVFRECVSLVSDLGSATIKTSLSSRTHSTVKEEESVTITFTSAEYGYIAGVDPTHVSVMIRRLGEDPTDSLPGLAYLTEAVITLPRD
jgi:hypothetical protein